MQNDLSQSNLDVYMNGNYSADDFARLTYQSTFQENSLAKHEEFTSCKRRQSSSFSLLTDGLNIDLEAMVIPHGEIKFAVFSIHKAERFLSHLPNRLGINDSRSKDEQTSPFTIDRGLTSPFAITFPEECAQLFSAYVPPIQSFPVSIPSSLSLIPTLTMAQFPQVDNHLPESLMNVRADPIEIDRKANSYMHANSYEGILPTNKADSLQTQADNRKQVAHMSAYGCQNALPSSSSSPSYPLFFTKPATSTIMNSSIMKKCLTCGKSNSPEWRKGPDGKKSLCNACGLRFSRNNTRRRKKEEKARIANEIAANGGTIPAHIRNRIEDERNRKKVEKSKKTKNINSKPPRPPTSQQQQKADKYGMDALANSSTVSDTRSSPSMHASSSKMNLNTSTHLPENINPTSH
ncbi:hypothetical protein L7F22_067913 [Adiantum nelumboides]|nr:hypothetical protein [Adiantum nelumboides]